MEAMGLGTHVVYTTRTNKLKNDEKEYIYTKRGLTSASRNNQNIRFKFDIRIEIELTIDRSRYRDGTCSFRINVAQREHEFLNS